MVRTKNSFVHMATLGRTIQLQLAPLTLKWHEVENFKMKIA